MARCGSGLVFRKRYFEEMEVGGSSRRVLATDSRICSSVGSVSLQLLLASVTFIVASPYFL